MSDHSGRSAPQTIGSRNMKKTLGCLKVLGLHRWYIYDVLNPVQEHAEDILCCSFTSPNSLATGSYDGEVILWNTNSEHASRHCAQRSRRGMVKSRGRSNLAGSPMREVGYYLEGVCRGGWGGREGGGEST